MASRSIRVAFHTDTLNDELEVHDIDVAEGIQDAPRILENPHVDFPGRWVLTGGDATTGWIYDRDREVADTNDTVAI
ncbi:MAG TPA: hypothetical protein VIG76_07445 [Amnibacterium sp.]|jgi:hypothetical protein|uniref:hypothetical protein n=1 Tax=Amnibacterium sp. TaxID=1872496 RepID=UPI002F92BF9E